MSESKTTKGKMTLEAYDDEFGASGIYWFGLMHIGKDNQDFVLAVARRIIEWGERNAQR